jgi:hypothetical protein
LTAPKSSQKLSFQDALLQEIANSPGGVKQPCAICESPNKKEIEEAHKRGVRFRVIGRTLQKIGEMPINLSQGTVSERVSTHFRLHQNGVIDGKEA